VARGQLGGQRVERLAPARDQQQVVTIRRVSAGELGTEP